MRIENLNDYFCRLMEFIDQMESYGGSIEDDHIARKLFISIKRNLILQRLQ